VNNYCDLKEECSLVIENESSSTKLKVYLCTAFEKNKE